MESLRSADFYKMAEFHNFSSLHAAQAPALRVGTRQSICRQRQMSLTPDGGKDQVFKDGINIG